MRRRLARGVGKPRHICCDGTWNTPDQVERGLPAPTNVVRLYNVVADTHTNGQSQHKYYHPGVGTDGAWWDRLLGGAIGKGLDQNIQSAYRELCQHYQQGDQIYLFGFSRGAYTVRSLAGLIACCGLLDLRDLSDDETWRRIGIAYRDCYRRKPRGCHGLHGNHPNWQFVAGHKVPIRFIGVWDTVGALGIPDDMALLNLIDLWSDYTFHNTGLSSTVVTARHAVALDEMRASFQPTLWTNIPQQADVKQVWFPGNHSDVGGGYRECGLSDGALMWMINEAAANGLAFDAGMVAQIHPNHQDVLHDSCNGSFSLLPTQPRGTPSIGTGIVAVHPSAIDRQTAPPITQAPYRLNRGLPVALDIFARNPWNDTGIYLEGGVTYTFNATGQWMDWTITCSPDGANNGTCHLGKLAHMAGTVWGMVEKAFKWVTGNRAADFCGTRRHEDAPWFCLMGAIANGDGANKTGYLMPHETFIIGSGRVYTPQKPGYLFTSANDAWNFYGNNRGRVRLTVT